jgi:hypothetical protein
VPGIMLGAEDPKGKSQADSPGLCGNCQLGMNQLRVEWVFPDEDPWCRPPPWGLCAVASHPSCAGSS